MKRTNIQKIVAIKSLKLGILILKSPTENNSYSMTINRNKS